MDSNRRFLTLDVIRGMAVMGILSVNILNFAMHQAAYLNPFALGPASRADLALWSANLLLIDGKFRSLFSMLFGASALLVMDRASAAGRSGAWTHVRRMLVLFLLGLGHAILIWRGDILTLYAMTGLLLLLFARLDATRLMVWGSLLLLVHAVLFAAITATLVHQDQVAHSAAATADIVRNWNANASSFFPTAQGIAADQAIYDGSWTDIVRFEALRLPAILSNSLAILPDTLGLMLLGMAAYKSGFFTGQWDDRAYRKVALWGIGVGLAGHAALVVADLATGFYVPLVVGGFLSAMLPFRLAQAAGYAALFILWTRRPGPVLMRIAAVGRTAFTNYLGTSIICTAIFYGWGLGLYGDLSRTQSWLVVPAVWALMLLWSRPWLDRFRYGPFEWLWRSLAQGRPQPMRKSA